MYSLTLFFIKACNLNIVPIFLFVHRSIVLHLLIFKEVKIRNAILSEPEFIFVDSMDYDAVIGVEVLQTVGFLIDMREDQLKWAYFSHF